VVRVTVRAYGLGRGVHGAVVRQPASVEARITGKSTYVSLIVSRRGVGFECSLACGQLEYNATQFVQRKQRKRSDK